MSKRLRDYDAERVLYMGNVTILSVAKLSKMLDRGEISLEDYNDVVDNCYQYLMNAEKLTEDRPETSE
jgi:hypothetical protein